MDNLEEKLGALLSDPDIMQKVQSLAQSLGQNTAPAPPVQESPSTNTPDFDLSLLQKLSGFASQTEIDSNQRTLLSALSPYLSHNRVSKLENAMRAAKMARLASVFLGNGGLQQFSGR